MALQKVQKGQPLQIPAETWNTFVDTAQWAREQQRLGRGAAQGGYLGSTVVPVENGTGADLDQFGVGMVNGPLFVPPTAEFLSRVALDTYAPTGADTFKTPAVFLEPVKSGGVGRACVAGICQAKIDMRDGTHEWCDVADGVTGHFRSSVFGGVRILWAEGGEPADENPNVKLAMVVLGTGGNRFFNFELLGRLWPSDTPPSSVDAILLDGSLDQVEGTDFTLYDPTNTHRGCKAADVGVSEGCNGYENTKGSTGIGWFNPNTRHHEIITMEEMAMVIVATASSGASTGDDYISINTPTVISPQCGRLTSGEGDVTQVENYFGWDVDAGARVLAQWKGTYDGHGNYIATQVTCPEEA